MNLGPIKLLIFDLDGTLLDSKIDITNSINRTLMRYGVPQIPSDGDLVWKFLGDGALYLVDRSFSYQKSSVPDGAVDFFVKDYEEHSLVQSRLYPHAREVLEKLDKFKKAILTNKNQAVTEKICKGLDIAKYFDCIIGAGKYKKKPDPEGILKILEYFKVAPRMTVMVGDTTNDLIAGERANVKRIAVTWGVHERSVLEAQKPDLIIDDMEELLESV